MPMLPMRVVPSIATNVNESENVEPRGLKHNVAPTPPPFIPMPV